MTESPRFRHGVASGDPAADRVVIWSRATPVRPDESIPVTWRVHRAADGRRVANGQALATAQGDWCVSVDVRGLDPATAYEYDFEALGEPSPVGRTRTLPSGEVEGLRFAQVSCAKYNAGFFNAYARLAERDDIAFVLHLGDYIYEASQTPPASQTPSKDIGRPFDPLGECRTLDDYRRRYAQYHADPMTQAVHAAHPFIGTVDDHEFADGAWRDGASEHKPERDGPWSVRKAAAFQARREWLPIRLPDRNDPSRVFRTVSIGSLADLFLIDTRTRRDEPVPPPEMFRADRTALGEEQRDWLLGEIRRSTARWRVLGNPSIMARTWNDALPDNVRRALVKVKLIDTDGTGPDYDQWDGYPHERRAFLSFLRHEGVNNVVVLSGDVHVAIAAELAEDPGMDPVAVEFVNTSLTSQNLDDKMGWRLRTESVALERAFLAGMPHLKHADFDSHGYSIVDVDRERVRFEWWNVPELHRPVAGQSLGGRFEARWGDPHVHPVDEPPGDVAPIDADTAAPSAST